MRVRHRRHCEARPAIHRRSCRHRSKHGRLPVSIARRMAPRARRRLHGTRAQFTCRSFPAQYGSRRCRRKILPDGLRGSASMKVDRLRRLEAGDAFAGEVDDVGGGRLLAGLHHHDRLDRFAPFVVGDADHRDFGDIGVVADRALDFGGIDVLAAGDDHVLDAVVDVEVAVLVHVAGIAGAQPAVAVERLGGRLRQVPVAHHVGAGAGGDLADLAGRQPLAVGVEDREFNAGQGLAGRAHAVQPLDVIFRRQRDDGAGGLGHAVHLHEAAFEHLDAFLQQRRRDRRGAVEHVFQPREIHLPRAGLPHHELHRGRHHEQLCDSGLLEEIQHLGRIELARDHAPGAVIEPHHAPAGAADMEDRHRHQRDVVGRPLVPFGLLGLVPVCTRLRKLACDSIAPFGLPVVPEV